MIDFLISLPFWVGIPLIIVISLFSVFIIQAMFLREPSGALGAFVVLLAIPVIGYFVFDTEKTPDDPSQNQPYTRVTDMQDGCKLTEYWNTRKDHDRRYSSTIKYVSCPNKEVTTVEEKSCGKNCSRQEIVVTK